MPLENRGFIVTFPGNGRERDLSQFDLAKLDGVDGEVVPKLILPSFALEGIPLDTGSESSEHKPDYVSTVLLVQYHTGRNVRELHFSVSITRAALEGQQCSCCLFHGNMPVCEGVACPIHG